MKEPTKATELVEPGAVRIPIDETPYVQELFQQIGQIAMERARTEANLRATIAGLRQQLAAFMPPAQG